LAGVTASHRYRTVGRGRMRQGASGRSTDYHSFTVQELRALLKDRGLVRKGRKEDLISRLLRDDASDLGAEQAQTVADVAPSAAAGRAASPVRPGDSVYFRAHTGRHLEVERDEVRARWDDHGDWQIFALEKSPLVIDDSDANAFHSGDLVFLKAHTGSFVDVDGEDVRARWADQNHGSKWQGLVIVKHGSGAVVPGDTVFLQAATGTYLDVQGEDVRARWEDEGEWQALVLEMA